MVITYDYEPWRRLLRVWVADSVDLPQIEAVVDRLLQDARLEPGFDILSDHAEIRSAATGALVRKALPLLDDLANRLCVGRFAVVSPSDASYGMARMAGLLSDAKPFEVRAFRTETEALAWLRPEAPGG